MSTIKPSIFEESRNDEHWVKAMKEELDQIEKNATWELVPRPKDKNVIGIKWVFINKKMKMDRSPETRRDWYAKGMLKLKE